MVCGEPVALLGRLAFEHVVRGYERHSERGRASDRDRLQRCRYRHAHLGASDEIAMRAARGELSPKPAGREWCGADGPAFGRTARPNHTAALTTLKSQRGGWLGQWGKARLSRSLISQPAHR